MFKRVVAYGCSFTAAEETADHEYFDMDEDELDLIKKSGGENRTTNKEFYEVVSNKGEFFSPKLQIAHSHKYSWASHLAQDLDCSLVMRAVPGTSLGHAVYEIQKSLFDGGIKEDDLVVIGVTTPNRIFKLLSPSVDQSIPYSRVLVGSWNEEEIDAAEWLIKYETNYYNLLWNYCQQLKILDYLSKHELKDRLLLVPALGPKLHQKLYYDMQAWGFRQNDFHQLHEYKEESEMRFILEGYGEESWSMVDTAFMKGHMSYAEFLTIKFGDPEVANDYTSTQKMGLVPYHGKIARKYLDLVENTILEMDSWIRVPSLFDFGQFLETQRYEKKVKHGWNHPTRHTHEAYYHRILKEHIHAKLS
jgi:hypothetical protein